MPRFSVKIVSWRVSSSLGQLNATFSIYSLVGRVGIWWTTLGSRAWTKGRFCVFLNFLLLLGRWHHISIHVYCCANPWNEIISFGTGVYSFFLSPCSFDSLGFSRFFYIYFKSKVVVSILKVCKSTTTGKTIILEETTVRMIGRLFLSFSKN